MKILSELDVKKSNYNQVQKVALLAYSYLRNNGNLSIKDAWGRAFISLAITSKVKGCPLAAFAGLVEYGRLVGFERIQVPYSTKNAMYANVLADLYLAGNMPLKASRKVKWDILREYIWKNKKFEAAQNENGQLSIVEAFYYEGLLK